MAKFFKNINANFVTVVDIGKSKISTIIASIESDKIDIKGIDSENFDYKKDNLKEKIKNIVNGAADKANIGRATIVDIIVTLSFDNDIRINKEKIEKDFLKSTKVTNKILNSFYNKNYGSEENSENISDDGQREYLIKHIQKYLLDDSEVINPLQKYCNKLSVQLLTITLPKNKLLNYIEEINDQYRIKKVILKPLATSLVLPSKYRCNTCIIDIGFDSTDIIFYKDNCLNKIEQIDIGSYHVSKDISIAFKLDYDEAEKIKIKYGICNHKCKDNSSYIQINDLFKSINKKNLSEVIFPRYYEIFYKIRNKIKDNNIDLCVLTGGGSEMEGVDKFAEEIFECKVEKCNKVMETDFEDMKIYKYTTALGTLLFNKYYPENYNEKTNVWNKIKSTIDWS